jgi:hypothetical protein
MYFVKQVLRSKFIVVFLVSGIFLPSLVWSPAAGAADCDEGPSDLEGRVRLTDLHRLPPGAEVTLNADASLTITPPPGFIHVGEDLNSLIFLPQIAVICTCHEPQNTMCSAFFDGDFYGCKTRSCTDCSLSLRTSGGFINLVAGVQLATADDVGQLPPAFDAMFDVPAVQGALSIFRAEMPASVAGGSGKDMVYLPVNVFGRLAALALPPGATNSLQSPMVGSSVRCKCEGDAEAACTVKTRDGLAYCGGDGCDLCTLDLGL